MPLPERRHAALAKAAIPRRPIVTLYDAPRDRRMADTISPDNAIAAALESLQLGLLVCSNDRILSANDAFCRIVGRGRDELLELGSVADLATPERRPDLSRRLARRPGAGGEPETEPRPESPDPGAGAGDQRARTPDRFETALIGARGAVVEVEVALQPIDGASRPTFVAIVRDVTAARREARIGRLLAEASDILAGARDDVDAIRAITRLVVPALADWCAFDLHDADGSLDRIAVAHVTPEGEAILWELDQRFPVRQFEGNLRARVLRSGVPLVMNDLTESTVRATARNHEHARLLTRLGMAAAMWVPATSMGRTLGLMSLGRLEPNRPFTGDELETASKLGHRAAQAIERSRADRTIRSRERQQAAVAELGRLALAGASLESLQGRAVALIAETLEVEIASALALDSDGFSLRVVAAIGWSPAAFGPSGVTVESATQAGYTISSGGPVIVEDFRTEMRFTPSPQTAQLGVVSGISVVIGSRGDRPRGVLTAHSTRRRRFGGDDVNFIQSMANVLATAIDRAASEAALRESDDRLHLALAASQTGTWEWDLRTGHLDWSDEIRLQHGLPSTHPAPSFDEYLLMIHPEDRELFQRTIGAALNGAGYDLEFRLLLPDGSIRWTNGQGRVFTDEAGRPIRMVGTGRDITDRKATEQERDSLLEQERTARELREAFIGVLSHELRTPITTILGGSRLLTDRMARLQPETTAELLSDIGAEAERLARLIEDLLILTRSERGSIEARDEPVLPAMVVDAVVTSSAGVRQRVTLDVQVPRNLPIVVGDETYVEQILHNLVGNAAKFSPAGSTVVIASEVTADEVLLRVLDEGPGIDPAETDLLFEVFYRSPRTKSKVAGSGIGLFVAQQLASAMGGRLWAHPRPTGGAEFGLALRRHEMPGEERGDETDQDAAGDAVATNDAVDADAPNAAVDRDEATSADRERGA